MNVKLSVIKPHVISARRRHAGETYELPEKLARIVIAAGLAERFRPERKRKPKQQDQADIEAIDAEPPEQEIMTLSAPTYHRRDMVAESQ